MLCVTLDLAIEPNQHISALSLSRIISTLSTKHVESYSISIQKIANHIT